MRIYISGPMTGKDIYNLPAFNAAAKRLRKQGHFVINPHDLSALFGTAEEIETSFREYYEVFEVCGADMFARNIVAKPVLERTRLARAIMSADLAAVRSCDAIYLLRGWETSRRAKKELAEAIAHGLQVMQAGVGK